MTIMTILVRQRCEKGSLVFAILSVAASSLAIVVLTGLIIYVCTSQNEQIDGQPLIPDLTDLSSWWSNSVVKLAVIQGLILVYFIFSVLLLNGVKNRKPRQVLSYFVSGIVISLLSLAGSVWWITLGPSPLSNNFVIGVVWMVITFIYILILMMIHMAYRKINSKESGKPKEEVITLKKNIIDGFGLPI